MTARGLASLVLGAVLLVTSCSTEQRPVAEAPVIFEDSASALPVTCLLAKSVLEDWSTGVVVHQCEEQSGWLVIQVNDFFTWDEFVWAFMDDSASAMAMLDQLPVFTFSAAMAGSGLTGAEYNLYILNFRDSCSTTYELSNSLVSRAVQAYNSGEAAWIAAIQDLSTEVTVTRLNSPGC
jgi:hypothetical protein